MIKSNSTWKIYDFIVGVDRVYRSGRRYYDRLIPSPWQPERHQNDHEVPGWGARSQSTWIQLLHPCFCSQGGYHLVLVRYSIYRSIAILVNVRYRYLVVSRYFDISSIVWIVDLPDDIWAIFQVSSIESNIEYRMIRFLICNSRRAATN